MSRKNKSVLTEGDDVASVAGDDIEGEDVAGDDIEARRAAAEQGAPAVTWVYFLADDSKTSPADSRRFADALNGARLSVEPAGFNRQNIGAPCTFVILVHQREHHIWQKPGIWYDNERQPMTRRMRESPVFNRACHEAARAVQLAKALSAS